MSGRCGSPQSYETTVMVNEVLNDTAAWPRPAGSAPQFSTALARPVAWQAIWPHDGLNVAANLRRQAMAADG
jgi:hypothetical protein